MVKVRFLAVSGILLLGSGRAAIAQDIDLATNGADVRWRGTTASALAGSYLDHGTMSSDDRRDLIIGAPGQTGSSTPGSVYILFGGPIPTAGEHPLDTANVVITGAANGDGFGAAVAAANVLNREGVNPRNLLVSAPNADGGRGVVYLFTTNYAGGERLTSSSAVFTVRGAPNDHLGAALASADLDFDGYRDIIIGAPGNNHVYVIWGGPGLSGTARDMGNTDATGPDITITGSGIGGVLTAGAFTGDSVYDLFIGAPSVNLVYMIQGLGNRSYQRNMIVQRDETAYFLGVTGDAAGSSLRMGDFDGDGRTDLLIGAPNAGGAQQGAAYVLWGKKPTDPAPISISLAYADVILRGPAPGAKLGQIVTSGDINRDIGEDVALVAPGATSGGAVYIYYGRGRSTYGTPQAAGNRAVDLSDPAQLSLRVLGDATAGGIATAFVYEVTGEGARDLIVGSPKASTSAGANSGRVYFAISPKMVLSAPAVVMTAVQNATSQAPDSVLNESPTTITFDAVSQTSWLSTSPVSGSAQDAAPGSFALNAAASGMAPGDYAGAFTVTSTSPHLTMSVPGTVALTVITPPTLAANTSMPAFVGTPITWTAQSMGGAAGVLYEFFRLDGSTWKLVQGWSATNTYSWTPTVNDAGTHALQVWVKTPQSTAVYDAYVGSATFAIQKSVPIITAFTNTGVFPMAPNTPVQFSVAAVGGSAALQFRFLLYKEGTGWSVLQDYGVGTQVSWTPTTTGNYAVQVWVRSTGVTDQYEAWAGTPMLKVSTTDPVTVQSVSADKPFPAKAGLPITFTAAASGGSAGPLQYQFVRYDEPTATWSIVQAYGAARTYSWTPGANAVGNHVVQVWVRSAGSSATYEAWGTTGMFAVSVDPIAVTLMSDVAFPVPAGTPVRWTLNASGGIAPLQYQFSVYRQGVGWTLGQDFSTSNTFNWTAPADGTYVIQVLVRNAGSTNTYDAWTNSGYFTIGPNGAAQMVRVTADQPMPVVAGTTVTWTGVATGGTAGPLQYRFVRYNQGTGQWSVAQEYSTSDRFTWTPSTSERGSYVLQVWVRSGGSAAVYEGWMSTGFFTIQ
ncbi:MAG TPA: hypothetical protein VGI12_11755 [Vicinamibacterales bacterium]|jgi:hypothetical protein